MQPPQSTTKCAATAAADQKALHAHQLAHRRKCVFIRRLHPAINICGVARENVRDKVIADAFHNILGTFICCIQSLWNRENASFLQDDIMNLNMQIGLI